MKLLLLTTAIVVALAGCAPGGGLNGGGSCGTAAVNEGLQGGGLATFSPASAKQCIIQAVANCSSGTSLDGTIDGDAGNNWTWELSLVGSSSHVCAAVITWDGGVPDVSGHCITTVTYEAKGIVIGPCLTTAPDLRLQLPLGVETG